MSFDFSKLLSVAWGGWTTTWPTQLLALIWLAWLASWVGASFWQGRTQKQVMTLESGRYRIPILVGGILFTPWTAEVLGENPLWVFSSTGVYIVALIVLAGIGVAIGFHRYPLALALGAGLVLIWVAMKLVASLEDRTLHARLAHQGRRSGEET